MQYTIPRYQAQVERIRERMWNTKEKETIVEYFKGCILSHNHICVIHLSLVYISQGDQYTSLRDLDIIVLNTLLQNIFRLQLAKDEKAERLDFGIEFGTYGIHTVQYLLFLYNICICVVNWLWSFWIEVLSKQYENFYKNRQFWQQQLNYGLIYTWEWIVKREKVFTTETPCYRDLKGAYCTLQAYRKSRLRFSVDSKHL